MSKSLKNYTDPMLLMNAHGADAMRAYLLSSQAVLLEDLSFRDDGLEEMVKGLLLPLWNALSFFSSYAEVDGLSPEDLDLSNVKSHLNELDKFILSETEILVSGVTESMERYGLDEAMRMFIPFLDTLTNWYIRRSRDRVWSADKRAPEKMAFYATTFSVLKKFLAVLAPFCPFVSEAAWVRLGLGESVHLSEWPQSQPELIDAELSRDTALVRSIVSAGLAIRSREKIRVRQPLSRMRVAVRGTLNLARYGQVIKNELNIKNVEVLHDASEIATPSAKVNARAVGPRLGARAQEIIRTVREGNFEVLGGGSIKVLDLVLNAGEVEVGYTGRDGLPVESGNGFVVALDTTITPELALEGKARDLVRQIQELRKEADLHVADRITLSINGMKDVMEAYGDYVQAETLTTSIVSSLADAKISKAVEVAGESVGIALRVA